MNYADRTPDSVKAELETYTEEGCMQLARFLQNFMANEHNARDFLCIAKEKDKLPHERMRSMFGHAYDWFSYGN